MAETFYFFDTGAGANVTESAWYLAMRTAKKTGVVRGQLNQGAPTADGGGMRVFVDTVQAWNEGHFYQNDASLTLTIGAAPASPNTRIDRVVCRLDRTAKTIATVVKAGVAANPGVVPALQQDSNIFEIPICQVNVRSGVVAILATDVVDERLWDDVEPSGKISATAASTPDAGWLMCDGSNVSRVTYNKLFSRIGTTWGAGDGSTTFGIPDFRGRTPIGAGAGTGLTARTLASIGGEETHVLLEAELAAHSHTGNVGAIGGHSHGGNTGGQSASHTHLVAANTVIAETSANRIAPSGSGQMAQADSGPSTGGASNDHTHGISTDGSHGHTISVDGSNTAHNNMQPYAAVNFQIKT